MQQKIIAKAIVFNADGSVLLLRRSATDDKRPGEWDFPGGEIDPGEDLTAGVIREMHEEAGITVAFDSAKLVYTETTEYEELYAIRLVYVTTVDHPEIQLSFEHDTYQWVAQDKVLELFPHPVYGKAFTNVLQYQLMQKET